MDVTLIFMFIGVGAGFYAYFIFDRARKGKVINNGTKKFWISAAISAIFIVSGFGISFIESSVNSDNSNEVAEQSSSSSSESSNDEEDTSSSSDEEETDDNKFTSTEIKKINKQLAKDLADNQKDATNGNKNYDYANYLLKITVDTNKHAKVVVDGSFTNLSEDAKNFVGEKTNGLIGRSIATAGVDYTPEDGREGTYMNFYNGRVAIGHSRFISNTKFKWYK